MRPSTLIFLSLLVACASAHFIDGTEAAVPRPTRPTLLDAAGRLAGRTITGGVDGPWITRSSPAPHAPVRDASATEVRRAADTKSYRGTSDVVPPSPGGGAGRSGPVGPVTGGRGGPATAGPSGPSSPGPGSAGGAHHRPGTVVPPAGDAALRLRAGALDDNRKFDAFLQLLAESRTTAGLQRRYVDLDVKGRCMIRVLDAAGLPAPGIEVRVIDDAGTDIVWRGTTYGDGLVPFYPQVAVTDGGDGGPYLIEVPVSEDRVVRHQWLGRQPTTVLLPTRRTVDETVAVDVAFVIDTTGSMKDEIRAIKMTLLQVTKQVRALARESDLRYAAVLYRDLNDAYVTRKHDFTGDIDAFDQALKSVEATGGGDGPESLNQALAVAIDGLDWRAGAARLAFLIADAPPHLDYENDVSYDQSLRAAVADGIRMHTVAASGLRSDSSLVFRQIAQFTRGEFVFVEYGNDLGASAAQHGIDGSNVTGNNLDTILYERIAAEVAGWGR